MALPTLFGVRPMPTAGTGGPCASCANVIIDPSLEENQDQARPRPRLSPRHIPGPGGYATCPCFYCTDCRKAGGGRGPDDYDLIG